MIARYLIANYYSRYRGPQKLNPPDEENLRAALLAHQDKLVTVSDGLGLRGVGLFLTLSDLTYTSLETIRLDEPGVLSRAMYEQGGNIHFILVTAHGRKEILSGLKAVIRDRDPKTVSWWNPAGTKLHRFKIKE